MKINCISCGFNVDLSEAYENYCGAVKCYVCGALLEIRVEDGNLNSVKLAGSPVPAEVAFPASAADRPEQKSL